MKKYDFKINLTNFILGNIWRTSSYSKFHWCIFLETNVFNINKFPIKIIIIIKKQHTINVKLKNMVLK